MHMVAGGDGALGEPDELAVFCDRRAIGDMRERNFVARARILGNAQAHRSVEQFVACFEESFDDCHAVGGMENDGGVVEFLLSHGMQGRTQSRGMQKAKEIEC